MLDSGGLCFNFSYIYAGLYLNHDMDLTEEDIQIWYFGPDDVGTKFKLSTWTYFSFADHPAPAPRYTDNWRY
jgi:hypothetical protein